MIGNIEKIDSERVMEFDDMDEHIDEKLPPKDQNVEIEKIILVYNDKKFEIITQKH